MAKSKHADVEGQMARASFGKNFGACRRKQRLSPSAIHAATGVPPAEIAQIESGQGRLSIDTMVKLAAIVRTPLWLLLRPRKRNQDFAP